MISLGKVIKLMGRCLRKRFIATRDRKCESLVCKIGSSAKLVQGGSKHAVLSIEK